MPPVSQTEVLTLSTPGWDYVWRQILSRSLQEKTNWASSCKNHVLIRRGNLNRGTQHTGVPGGTVVKNPPANAGVVGWSLGQEDPLQKERATHGTPIFLPGKSHRQRSPVCCSPWDHKESDANKKQRNTQGRTVWAPSEKVAIYKPSREASEETNSPHPTTTSISGF